MRLSAVVVVEQPRMELTGTEAVGVGDGGGCVRSAAGLVGAVTDAVTEVGVVAIA